MIQLAWLLPLLPVLAFAVTGLFTQRSKNLTVGIVVGVFAICFAISCGIGLEVLGGAATMNQPIEYGLEWLRLGALTIEAGILIDPLTAMMLFVVCLVALLVAIYSIGYLSLIHISEPTRPY